MLAIVKRLMKLGDNNAVILLNAITEEVIECKEIVCWWFSIKIKSRNCNNNNQFTLQNNNINNNNSKQAYIHNSISTSMQASSIMCDEIVHLWKLIVLNPKLTKLDKDNYTELIKTWHSKSLKTVFERYREDDSMINELDKHPGK